MYTDVDIRRLEWQSRRGMLELDVLLGPFVRERFSSLSEDDQDRFVKLLDCEDQDLFLWFMQRVEPDDADTKRIVDIILKRIESN